MGATYTRQSSAGITDGAVIEASDLNDEFDQLLASFVAASGHTHDGTAAEGGPVTKLLGTAITIGDATAGTDIAVTFDGESNDGVITWMEDEDLFKFSDAINVGVNDTGYDVKFFGATSGSYWLWDESADGVTQIGTLTVGVNDAGHDVKFFGDTASAYMLWDTSADDLILAGGAGLVIPDAGNIGSASDTDAVAISSAGVVALSATTEASATGTAALTLAGGLGVAKDVWIGDDLVLDSDSTVLKFGDDQDTTLTHTDGTGLTLNSTNKLCFYDTALSIHSSADGQLDLIADTEIQIAATTIDINGAVAMDGAITGATDITLSGELDAATLDISSNADIDGTTNLDAVDIDGAVQIDATFTSGVDGQGYDTKFFGDTASAYMLWDTSADDLVLAGAAGIDLAGDIDVDGTANLDAVDIDGAVQIDNTVTVGENDTGYDVKFFGATSGAYMLWDENTDDLVLAGAAKLYLYDAAGGEYLSSDGTELTIASGSAAWILPAADGSADQYLKTDGSGNLDWASVSGGVSLSGSTNNTIATVTGANALIGEANLTFTGSALTCIGTVTVGVDGTGHDVQYYGDTASSYMLWDESADSLLLNAATLDLNGTADGLILDADGDTTISSPSDDQIDFEIAGADDFTMTANTFTILSGSTIAIAAGGAITNAGTMAPDITSTGKSLVMGF